MLQKKKKNGLNNLKVRNIKKRQKKKKMSFRQRRIRGPPLKGDDCIH